MRRSIRLSALSKVSYRPIEAAVRWSGLLKYEPRILKAYAGASTLRHAPPKWPELQLNLDRIIDAVRNRELPASIAGVTTDTVPLVDHSALVIRHVDLRAWMTRFYPECRPPFLFGSLERSLGPTISIETVHALLIEREALRVQLEQLGPHAWTRAASTAERVSPRVPSLDTRGETTHLNILGCLLKLMLGSSPSGQPYSTFRSQEALIDALISHYGDRLGISERTLQSKFAAARRALNR